MTTFYTIHVKVTETVWKLSEKKAAENTVLCDCKNRWSQIIGNTTFFNIKLCQPKE